MNTFNRMNQLRRFLPWMLLAGLQGCASMNADQCKVADWRTVGYRDGALGKSAAAIGEYQKDCAAHAVVPDLDAWRAGRDAGLQEYCKPENGFRLGQGGKAWNPVCPDSHAAKFQAAYHEGRTIYLARSRVNKTSSLIYKQRHAMDELQEEKRDKLAELVQDGLVADQRVLLLYEIHEIDEQYDRLAVEISELERQLDHEQAQLDRLTR